MLCCFQTPILRGIQGGAGWIYRLGCETYPWVHGLDGFTSELVHVYGIMERVLHDSMNKPIEQINSGPLENEGLGQLPSDLRVGMLQAKT